MHLDGQAVRINRYEIDLLQSIQSLFKTSPEWRPQQRQEEDDAQTPSPSPCDAPKNSAWNFITKPVSMVKRRFHYDVNV